MSKVPYVFESNPHRDDRGKYTTSDNHVADHSRHLTVNKLEKMTLEELNDVRKNTKSGAIKSIVSSELRRRGQKVVD